MRKRTNVPYLLSAVSALLLCVCLLLVPVFAEDGEASAAEPSTNGENASETVFEEEGEQIPSGTKKTEWEVFFEEKILPNIVAVVTALSALYLALMPLIVRVKNTSTMIEQSSKRVDDAASLAENSKKQYEETSGEIRKNNETVAGFEGRLSLVEKQNREIISILKNGFCNMDEMVKKGYAEQIARIGNDGEGETDEADEAEK